MKKNNLGIGVSVVMAFFTGVLGTYLVLSNNPAMSKSIIENVSKVQITETSIASSVDKIYNAVGAVISYKNEKKISSGTGFIYKKENGKGYIMTNNHVVDGADKVTITFSNNQAVDATIIGKEVFSDIAVLTIPDDKILMVSQIGKSTDLRVGDTLFAVGTPLGINYSGTVTKGILSGKDRLVEVSMSGATSTDWIMKVLQTDAAINPGNSGGPLVNINGEVIGITSLKLVQEQIEGMGFAIPIEDALYYADILEKGESIQRPYIGIGMLDFSETYYIWSQGIKVDPSITSGVIISEVVPDSAADKAGLKIGDVIYEIEGEKVETKAQFRYQLYKHQPGDKIKIKYYHGKDKKNCELVLSTNQ